MIRFGTSIAGTVGFFFVFGLRMTLDRDWSQAIISASIAALAFGFLAHWWMSLWFVSLKFAREEQARQKNSLKENMAPKSTDQDVAEPGTETTTPETLS